MLNILYSFNKTGFEAEYWEREISAASTDRIIFIPFNHGRYADCALYIRAQKLDELYYAQDSRLLRLYADVETLLTDRHCNALIVDNCPPYHPDYLKRIGIHKILRIADGPISSYDRDFAYLHAYDTILYHSPAYSRDMGMAEKLRYCGAKDIVFWPHGAFDALRDTSKTEATILGGNRDIDIIFVGALYFTKMPLLAKLKKLFGSRCRIHGATTWKRNLYYNVKYGFPGWLKPIPFTKYVPLYQRAKIGFNVHNRDKYTVGSYRLFDLPANGVMQISDGGEYLDAYFSRGKEIVPYANVDELIDKIRYYLAHEDERQLIALNGYRRVMREHLMSCRMSQLREIIERRLLGPNE